MCGFELVGSFTNRCVAIQSLLYFFLTLYFFLAASIVHACEINSSGALVCAETHITALREAGGQARRAGQPELSEKIFNFAVTRYPDQPAVELDLAVVLIDQDKFPQAISLLDKYHRRFGESESYWMTRGYLYDRQREFSKSFFVYDEALKINPSSKDALRQKINTVDTLGMPDKALELAEQHNEVLSDEDWLRLRMDSAAYAVRIAGNEDKNPLQQQKNIRTAINLCDQVIAYIKKNFPEQTADLQTVRFDRLLVWSLDNRHQAVLDEYALLVNEHAVTRDDASVVTAQSAMYLEYPELAIDLLLPVTKKNPSDANAQFLLFYAYLDNEDFDNAQRVLDGMESSQSPWRVGRSSKIAGKNWDRVTLDSNRLMFAAWSGDLDAAYSGMKDYLERAPYNSHLRVSFADIHYLRGWPRQSLDLYQEVENQQPGIYAVKSGSINAWMRLYDYQPAKKMTQVLAKDYPDLKSTETHIENWSVHNMQELDVTVGLGKSDSNSSAQGDPYGSRDLEAEVWWYSKPLDYQNRIFLHTTSATGDFKEGKGQIDRYGVGWEQRLRAEQYTFRNKVEVNRNYSTEADTGISLSSDMSVNDYWSFAGSVESFSSQLPVRAYNSGVTAWSAEASAKYRVDDRQDYRASITNVDFSDNNQRWMWSGNGDQVFYRSPHHQWSILESIYASENSKTDVIYFSPERDLDVGLALEYEGIIERDYDFQFTHKLLIGVGVYNQKNYGSDPTAQLSYRHNWQKDKTLSWFYGVGLNYHPYDGNSELRQSVFGGFEWRFD